MKNVIRENAKKYFEEELSGEPLYQDLVIDWLTEFAERQLKILNIPVVSNNEVALKAFVEEFVEAWDDGMAGDTDLYRKAKSLL